jgi:hypothetical protein
VHVSRTDDEWSPYFKVAPAIYAVKSACKTLCNLGADRVVDESGIGYKGRAISWVQFNPNKPIKHAIKVFVLACSTTNYVWNFDIYTGKENYAFGSNKVSTWRDLLSTADCRRACPTRRSLIHVQ